MVNFDICLAHFPPENNALVMHRDNDFSIPIRAPDYSIHQLPWQPNAAGGWDPEDGHQGFHYSVRASSAGRRSAQWPGGSPAVLKACHYTDSAPTTISRQITSKNVSYSHQDGKYNMMYPYLVTHSGHQTPLKNPFAKIHSFPQKGEITDCVRVQSQETEGKTQ